MPLSDQDRSTPVPTMQHRHFAFIADVIRSIPTPSARVEAARQFASNLSRTNYAFDRYRFLDACDCHAVSMTLEQLHLAIATASFWLEHLKQEFKSRGFHKDMREEERARRKVQR